MRFTTRLPEPQSQQSSYLIRDEDWPLLGEFKYILAAITHADEREEATHTTSKN
jgi:hypothetical protein